LKSLKNAAETHKQDPSFYTASCKIYANSIIDNNFVASQSVIFFAKKRADSSTKSNIKKIK